MLCATGTRHGHATLLATLALPLVFLAAPRSALAQHDGHHSAGATTSSASDDDTGAMIGRAMDDAMKTGPHMRMTALRPPSEADSRRAADVAVTLRRAIAKYQDVKVAEADGYRMFAPRAKSPRIYHFTSRARALQSAVRFDPDAPTALLYRKNERGDFVLVGAMYTAPRTASEAELDRRVPLSVARWHQHVDICVPKLRELDRWNETDGGRMRFGPAGTITTRAECDAAGGRFREQSFGWMVHANVFASDDPSVIWGHDHPGKR